MIIIINPYPSTIFYWIIAISKASPTEFSFTGGSSSYIQNKNIELRDVPVKYGGIDSEDGIKLYRTNETIVLEEGLDYTVDYGADGVTDFLPLRLPQNAPGSQGILPMESDIIKVEYQYTPSISETKQNQPIPLQISKSKIL